MADRQAGGVIGTVSVDTSQVERSMEDVERLMDRSAEKSARAAERKAEAERRAAEKAAEAVEKAEARKRAAAERTEQRHIDQLNRHMDAVNRAAEREIAAAERVAERKRQAIRKQMEAAEASYRRGVSGLGGGAFDDLPSVGGGGGGGRGGAGGRAAGRGALSRSVFAGLNMAQDFEAAGMRGITNNLIQPTLWKDMATAAGAGRVALAGFGTAAVAVGGAFLAIDNGLRQANLGWGDFLSVVGNLAPVEAAGQAIGGVKVVIDEFFGVDVGGQLNTWAGDLAEWAVGWRSATEAVKLHNEAVAEAEGIAKKFAGVSQRFQSDQQKAQGSQGERFGSALANAGGSGGLAGIVAKLGGTKGASSIQAMINSPTEGNTASQGKLIGLMNSAGLDTTDLANIRGGGQTRTDKALDILKEGGVGGGSTRQPVDTRVAGYASDLQERYTRARSGGTSIGAEDVGNALAEAGVPSEVAAKLREDVLASLEEVYQTGVTSRALADKVSPAEAAGRIAQDDRMAGEEKRRAAEEKADREAMAAVQDASPSMAGQARETYLRGVMSGGNANAVGRQIGDQAAAALKAKGMDPAQAERAGQLVSAEARAGAERELADRLSSGRDAMEKWQPRNAELISGAELYSRVVSGVGPTNDQAKIVQGINRSNELLQQIANAGGNQRARLV